MLRMLPQDGYALILSIAVISQCFIISIFTVRSLWWLFYRSGCDIHDDSSIQHGKEVQKW